MSRDRNERDIDNLYGFPGAGHDTQDGRLLIMDLLEREGLSALTDDAVERLAALHRAHDERPR